MAAEIKLFARRFCPRAVARFRVQTKCFSGRAPKIFIRPFQHAALFKPDPANLFRQLEPPRQLDKSPKLLQNNTKAVNFLKGLHKTLTFRRKKQEDQGKNKKRVPKLVLVENPFIWIKTKIYFRLLRFLWDPGFDENEFKFGTKQAISKITSLISDGQYPELNGLLTKAARLSLIRELDRNWNIQKRSLLALKRDDIQISSPRKVYFVRIGGELFVEPPKNYVGIT
ncbi:Uncharacterized protein OBRU01_10859 [Operophtera brumata]|uniref:Uncharacterized protein n=1 Tax=Operophtera brumata TaxID=104452 RepID=A0A0L7LDU9_OPEBR|nr:Uncharacterized protein OBRU01_10859 [Operophtera brumata]